MVDQQALAHRQQVSTRLAQVREGLLLMAGQHADEGVLGQVGGIPCVAQSPPQPGFQPATVFVIEVLQGDAGCHNCIVHSAHAGAER
ncbi:hypothetical protein D3C85_747520 [compost metagenome]